MRVHWTILTPYHPDTTGSFDVTPGMTWGMALSKMTVDISDWLIWDLAGRVSRDSAVFAGAFILQPNGGDVGPSGSARVY